MHSTEVSKIPDIERAIDDARIKTWDAITKIKTAIIPGMKESEAIREAQGILAGMGSRKFWHKCHIRFGGNTVLSFNDEYRDLVLGENDIYYIDLGPIWNGIEGDAGATFVVGKSPDYERCRDDSKKVFDGVAKHWQKTGASGQALYEYAGKLAGEMGWELAPSYVRGHRLSEFPHSMYSGLTLDTVDYTPASHRWVLEVHICDPSKKFGAFYEDALAKRPSDQV